MNKKQFVITLFTVGLAILITSCGTTSGTPVLERNAYYQKVGHEQAEEDIKQVIIEAKKDIAAIQEARKEDLETKVKEGAISSGRGTAVYILTGRAALGTLTGGGPKTYEKIQEGQQDKKKFRKNVEKRLMEKGYQVKSW